MRNVFSIKKVTLFAFLVALFLGFGYIEAKPADACSYYDGYSCGSYVPSNYYGNYYGYSPYYNNSVGCGTYCDGYGYSIPYYGGYNGGYTYVNYPTYQYVQNPQVNRGANGGGGLSSYNYVQYPYYDYTYFQNPTLAQSGSSYGTYNYVQYPYPTYVYNR